MALRRAFALAVLTLACVVAAAHRPVVPKVVKATAEFHLVTVQQLHGDYDAEASAANAETEGLPRDGVEGDFVRYDAVILRALFDQVCAKSRPQIDTTIHGHIHIH